MYKFICANINKSRSFTSSYRKLAQTKKLHQDYSRPRTTSGKTCVDENADENQDYKDDENGGQDNPKPLSSSSRTQRFSVAPKWPSFKTIHPASSLKMKEYPKFYTGNFIVVDPPTPSISKKYYHVYSINPLVSTKRSISFITHKSFISEESQENYRQAMDHLHEMERNKSSSMSGSLLGDACLRKYKKKSSKPEISYPTHTIKHNLKLSKRYKIREGSAERKVKELEEKFKARKKLQMNVFKSLNNKTPYLSLTEQMKKGKYNKILVRPEPKPRPLEWKVSSEVLTGAMRNKQKEGPQVSCDKVATPNDEQQNIEKDFESLIKSHPTIENASKEVKMKLKTKFIQLLLKSARTSGRAKKNVQNSPQTEAKAELDSGGVQKGPNQAEENQNVPPEVVSKETTQAPVSHPRNLNKKEERSSMNIRYPRRVWLDTANNYDVEDVCIKETATRSGSGLISSNYGKEQPKPNYKNIEREAVELSKFVDKFKNLQQQSEHVISKLKTGKESPESTSAKLEKLKRERLYFMGELKKIDKFGAFNKNSAPKEAKADHYKSKNVESCFNQTSNANTSNIDRMSDKEREILTGQVSELDKKHDKSEVTKSAECKNASLVEKRQRRIGTESKHDSVKFKKLRIENLNDFGKQSHLYVSDILFGRKKKSVNKEMPEAVKVTQHNIEKEGIEGTANNKELREQRTSIKAYSDTASQEPNIVNGASNSAPQNMTKAMNVENVKANKRGNIDRALRQVTKTVSEKFSDFDGLDKALEKPLVVNAANNVALEKEEFAKEKEGTINVPEKLQIKFSDVPEFSKANDERVILHKKVKNDLVTEKTADLDRVEEEKVLQNVFNKTSIEEPNVVDVPQQEGIFKNKAQTLRVQEKAECKPINIEEIPEIDNVNEGLSENAKTVNKEIADSDGIGKEGSPVEAFNNTSLEESNEVNASNNLSLQKKGFTNKDLESSSKREHFETGPGNLINPPRSEEQASSVKGLNNEASPEKEAGPIDMQETSKLALTKRLPKNDIEDGTCEKVKLGTEETANAQESSEPPFSAEASKNKTLDEPNKADIPQKHEFTKKGPETMELPKISVDHTSKEKVKTGRHVRSQEETLPTKSGARLEEPSKVDEINESARKREKSFHRKKRIQEEKKIRNEIRDRLHYVPTTVPIPRIDKVIDRLEEKVERGEQIKRKIEYITPEATPANQIIKSKKRKPVTSSEVKKQITLEVPSKFDELNQTAEMLIRKKKVTVSKGNKLDQPCTTNNRNESLDHFDHRKLKENDIKTELDEKMKHNLDNFYVRKKQEWDQTEIEKKRGMKKRQTVYLRAEQNKSIKRDLSDVRWQGSRDRSREKCPKTNQEVEANVRQKCPLEGTKTLSKEKHETIHIPFERTKDTTKEDNNRVDLIEKKIECNDISRNVKGEHHGFALYPSNNKCESSIDKPKDVVFKHQKIWFSGSSNISAPKDDYDSGRLAEYASKTKENEIIRSPSMDEREKLKDGAGASKDNNNNQVLSKQTKHLIRVVHTALSKRIVSPMIQKTKKIQFPKDVAPAKIQEHLLNHYFKSSPLPGTERVVYVPKETLVVNNITEVNDNGSVFEGYEPIVPESKTDVAVLRPGDEIVILEKNTAAPPQENKHKAVNKPVQTPLTSEPALLNMKLLDEALSLRTELAVTQSKVLVDATYKIDEMMEKIIDLEKFLKKQNQPLLDERKSENKLRITPPKPPKDKGKKDIKKEKSKGPNDIVLPPKIRGSKPKRVSNERNEDENKISIEADKYKGNVRTDVDQKLDKEKSNLIEDQAQGPYDIILLRKSETFKPEIVPKEPIKAESEALIKEITRSEVSQNLSVPGKRNRDSKHEKPQGPNNSNLPPKIGTSERGSAPEGPHKTENKVLVEGDKHKETVQADVGQNLSEICTEKMDLKQGKSKVSDHVILSPEIKCSRPIELPKELHKAEKKVLVEENNVNKNVLSPSVIDKEKKDLKQDKLKEPNDIIVFLKVRSSNSEKAPKELSNAEKIVSNESNKQTNIVQAVLGEHLAQSVLKKLESISQPNLKIKEINQEDYTMLQNIVKEEKLKKNPLNVTKHKDDDLLPVNNSRTKEKETFKEHKVALKDVKPGKPVDVERSEQLRTHFGKTLNNASKEQHFIQKNTNKLNANKQQDAVKHILTSKKLVRTPKSKSLTINKVDAAKNLNDDRVQGKNNNGVKLEKSATQLGTKMVAKPLGGKLVSCAMRSSSNEKSNSRSNSRPAKSIKFGIEEAKTKYSSWSWQGNSERHINSSHSADAAVLEKVSKGTYVTNSEKPMFIQGDKELPGFSSKISASDASMRDTDSKKTKLIPEVFQQKNYTIKESSKSKSNWYLEESNSGQIKAVLQPSQVQQKDKLISESERNSRLTENASGQNSTNLSSTTYTSHLPASNIKETSDQTVLLGKQTQQGSEMSNPMLNSKKTLSNSSAEQSKTVQNDTISKFSREVEKSSSPSSNPEQMKATSQLQKSSMEDYKLPQKKGIAAGMPDLLREKQISGWEKKLISQPDKEATPVKSGQQEKGTFELEESADNNVREEKEASDSHKPEPKVFWASKNVLKQPSLTNEDSNQEKHVEELFDSLSTVGNNEEQEHASSNSSDRMPKVYRARKDVHKLISLSDEIAKQKKSVLELAKILSQSLLADNNFKQNQQDLKACQGPPKMGPEERNSDSTKEAEKNLDDQSNKLPMEEKFISSPMKLSSVSKNTFQGKSIFSEDQSAHNNKKEEKAITGKSKLCRADENLQQEEPIGILNIVLPKPTSPISFGRFSEGKTPAQKTKLSTSNPKLLRNPSLVKNVGNKISKAGISTTPLNSLNEKDQSGSGKNADGRPKGTKERKGNKDKKAIFRIQYDGEVFIVQRADENEKKEALNYPDFDKQTREYINMIMNSIDTNVSLKQVDQVANSKSLDSKNKAAKRNSTTNVSEVSTPIPALRKSQSDTTNRASKVANPKLVAKIEQILVKPLKENQKEDGLDAEVKSPPSKARYDVPKTQSKEPRAENASVKELFKENVNKTKASEKQKEDDIMYLNRKYSAMLKKIEESLAKKRKILELKTEQIKQATRILGATPKDTLANNVKRTKSNEALNKQRNSSFNLRNNKPSSEDMRINGNKTKSDLNISYEKKNKLYINKKESASGFIQKDDYFNKSLKKIIDEIKREEESKRAQNKANNPIDPFKDIPYYGTIKSDCVDNSAKADRKSNTKPSNMYVLKDPGKTETSPEKLVKKGSLYSLDATPKSDHNKINKTRPQSAHESIKEKDSIPSRSKSEANRFRAKIQETRMHRKQAGARSSVKEVSENKTTVNNAVTKDKDAEQSTPIDYSKKLEKAKTEPQIKSKNANNSLVDKLEKHQSVEKLVPKENLVKEITAWVAKVSESPINRKAKSGQGKIRQQDGATVDKNLSKPKIMGKKIDITEVNVVNKMPLKASQSADVKSSMTKTPKINDVSAKSEILARPSIKITEENVKNDTSPPRKKSDSFRAQPGVEPPVRLSIKKSYLVTKTEEMKLRKKKEFHRIANKSKIEQNMKLQERNSKKAVIQEMNETADYMLKNESREKGSGQQQTQQKDGKVIQPSVGGAPWGKRFKKRPTDFEKSIHNRASTVDTPSKEKLMSKSEFLRMKRAQSKPPNSSRQNVPKGKLPTNLRQLENSYDIKEIHNNLAQENLVAINQGLPKPGDKGKPAIGPRHNLQNLGKEIEEYLDERIKRKINLETSFKSARQNDITTSKSQNDLFKRIEQEIEPTVKGKPDLPRPEFSKEMLHFKVNKMATLIANNMKIMDEQEQALEQTLAKRNEEKKSSVIRIREPPNKALVQNKGVSEKPVLQENMQIKDEKKGLFDSIQIPEKDQKAKSKQTKEIKIKATEENVEALIQSNLVLSTPGATVRDDKTKTHSTLNNIDKLTNKGKKMNLDKSNIAEIKPIPPFEDTPESRQKQIDEMFSLKRKNKLERRMKAAKVKETLHQPLRADASIVVETKTSINKKTVSSKQAAPQLKTAVDPVSTPSSFADRPEAHQKEIEKIMELKRKNKLARRMKSANTQNMSDQRTDGKAENNVKDNKRDLTLSTDKEKLAANVSKRQNFVPDNVCKHSTKNHTNKTSKDKTKGFEVQKNCCKKIILPMQKPILVINELMESYESMFDKPVGDTIKKVPKEILEMEEKAKKASSHKSADSLAKYRHLKITYMTVTRPAKKEGEKFLPPVCSNYEKAETEEKNTKIINFRYKLLKRLNTEFRKQLLQQLNPPSPTEMSDTQKTPSKNDRSAPPNAKTKLEKTDKEDMNSGKVLDMFKPAFRASFETGLPVRNPKSDKNKNKQKNGRKHSDDDNKKGSGGVRHYSTHSDECNGSNNDDKKSTDLKCETTDVCQVVSECIRGHTIDDCDNSQGDINEMPESTKDFDITEAAPQAFECASPRLEEERQQNLYYRYHQWSFLNLHEYLGNQRVFAIDAAEKKKQGEHQGKTCADDKKSNVDESKQ